MNFQDKVFESTADFRARATALAETALASARARAGQAAQRADSLKVSIETLQVAGRELGTVARRHVSRFVKENAGIAREAGRDVAELARATYSKLANREAPATRKPRRIPARKRATSRARHKAA